MVNGLWGKKVGMTQIFVQEDGRALPVTVIEVTGWFVTQIKDEIVDDKTTTAFINVYMRHITLALGDFDKRVNMARTAFEKRECIRIIALERVGEK